MTFSPWLTARESRAWSSRSAALFLVLSGRTRRCELISSANFDVGLSRGSWDATLSRQRRPCGCTNTSLGRSKVAEGASTSRGYHSEPRSPQPAPLSPEAREAAGRSPDATRQRTNGAHSPRPGRVGAPSAVIPTPTAPGARTSSSSSPQRSSDGQSTRRGQGGHRFPYARSRPPGVALPPVHR